MYTFVEELVETALRALPGRWALVAVAVGAGAMTALLLTQLSRLFEPGMASTAGNAT